MSMSTSTRGYEYRFDCRQPDEAAGTNAKSMAGASLLVLVLTQTQLALSPISLPRESDSTLSTRRKELEWTFDAHQDRR